MIGSRAYTGDEGVGFVEYLPFIMSAATTARQNLAKPASAPVAPKVKSVPKPVAPLAPVEEESPTKKYLPWAIGGGAVLLVGVTILVLATRKKKR